MSCSPADNTQTKIVFFDKGGSENYDLDELLRSSAEVLGKGTFGTSYKVPKYGVVVKRLKHGCLSEMEFIEKIQRLGSVIVHQYLVPIKAFCCHQNERLLLYDYLSFGSLAFVLHGNGGAKKTSLTWEVRCSIAYRVARAVEYLHSHDICHGNIRSSNVFLTNSLDAYLSEYAISQLLSPDAKPKPNITAGYCAPEVTNANEVSQKSDVYSFGVLLFELLTGKAPTNALNVKEKGTDLPKWVISMFQEKPLIDVFDNALHGCFNTDDMGEQMVQLLQLALCCTFQYPNKRPSMVAATNKLRETCRFEP